VRAPFQPAGPANPHKFGCKRTVLRRYSGDYDAAFARYSSLVFASYIPVQLKYCIPGSTVRGTVRLNSTVLS